MDTNILLESGTNELEVLEFTLGDNYYGINVAKIREILTYQQVTPVPQTCRSDGLNHSSVTRLSHYAAFPYTSYPHY